MDEVGIDEVIRAIVCDNKMHQLCLLWESMGIERQKAWNKGSVPTRGVGGVYGFAGVNQTGYMQQEELSARRRPMVQ